MELTSIELIRRLVAFDTVSRKSNLALIAFLQEYFADHRVGSMLVHDETGTKANLYATVGPQDTPGIALSAHTDVVPVEGQDWDSDPFTLRETADRLYGRGACDMKGFIGVALSLLPEMTRRRLHTPIHFSLSYDEEVGCQGVPRLLAELETQPIRPRGCIVGEPTGMRLVTGHKGKLALRCRVTGLESHSALVHRGVNAIEAAAAVVLHIKSIAERFKAEGPHDHRYDPPYSTAQTGVIHGGTAINIVPGECSFDFEFRHLAGVDPEALAEEVRRHAEENLLPEMRRIAPEAGFAFMPLSRFPGLAMEMDSEIARLVSSILGSDESGTVSFGTEAGLFEKSGIPSVVCGPGDIAQAHKPNEFLMREQVERCETFLRRLIDRLSVS